MHFAILWQTQTKKYELTFTGQQSHRIKSKIKNKNVKQANLRINDYCSGALCATARTRTKYSHLAVILARNHRFQTKAIYGAVAPQAKPRILTSAARLVDGDTDRGQAQRRNAGSILLLDPRYNARGGY